MPLIENPSPSLLLTITGPPPPARLYVIFSSIDAGTGKIWCPDCRAVESTVRQSFEGADAPTAIVRSAEIAE
ncbi:hypothetical protein BOTBODRAFT_171918 [Botryobasidium botryosum FD-172 SS1]|uniref:Thioredoxin domain-containing protein n=1 Tax=Botryobasidium botryosum (strain FD-172 SS1) TaxID=930990 RepID=A0A067MU87_BOTB1|nr:hypothetical protein BOTBODRAFT_171918 [Botryobasidium botryosum FD-172 SS1]